MDIEQRLRESEQRFEQKKAERDQYLQTADECLTEMTKLQGEYRLLQQLLNEQFEKEPKKVNKKADTIEAVPEMVAK